MNDYLSGDAPELAVSNFTDLVLGQPKKGGAVVTTIRTDAAGWRRSARWATCPGAVVAIDPRTGDVMAHGREPDATTRTSSRRARPTR